jgi:hypothetical protein
MILIVGAGLASDAGGAQSLTRADAIAGKAGSHRVCTNDM